MCWHKKTEYHLQSGKKKPSRYKYTTTNLQKIGKYARLYYNNTICKIQTVDNYTESTTQAVQQINKGTGRVGDGKGPFRVNET